MSDQKKQYITGNGFIQFDPQVREANGKTVTDVVIKLPGGDQTQLRITVWPEIQVTYQDKPHTLAKGDYIAVDGEFTSSTFQGKDGAQRTSLQVSAYNLAVLGISSPRAEREVVSSSSSSTTEKVPF